MRAFAAAWLELEIVQQTVAQWSWGQNIALLEKLKTPDERLWYALAGTAKPISVAEWETQLTRSLPDELKGSLPSIEEIEAELAGEVEGSG